MEEKIYNVLLREWFIIDELSKKLTVTVSELSFKLSMMEISGLIKKWIWWKYEVL
jgi:predicted Rossmann fold nucleotide-binding protein DprA/Smf involved in DNA uptake